MNIPNITLIILNCLFFYRTDTRGVNLNRVYGNPSLELNPTIYAARKLILYAHLGKDVNEMKPDTETGFYFLLFKKRIGNLHNFIM